MLGIVNKLRYLKLRQQWKVKNKGNYTIPINLFEISSVEVGNGTYGEIRLINYNNINKLIIGAYCSIGQDVTFILDANHATDCISTYPFKVKCLQTEKYEATSKGNIVIKDDVWIGFGSIILSGITIGQGAVVAAGSVVTKDVPAYAVVGGNPAKVIKYRFDEAIIDKLSAVDYSTLSVDTIKKNIGEFYKTIKSLEDLEWLSRLGVKNESKEYK